MWNESPYDIIFFVFRRRLIQQRSFFAAKGPLTRSDVTAYSKRSGGEVNEQDEDEEAPMDLMPQRKYGFWESKEDGESFIFFKRVIFVFTLGFLDAGWTRYVFEGKDVTFAVKENIFALEQTANSF